MEFGRALIEARGGNTRVSCPTTNNPFSTIKEELTTMIGLIGAILAVIISLCWYLPAVRAQGENRVLTKKDYWKTAAVYGFCYTCL